MRKRKIVLAVLATLFFFVGATYYLFPYKNLVKDFLWSDFSEVNTNGKSVNILVLGRAGGAHAGPDLTDTMILASISLINPSIKLISIPRDIWIPELKTKINSTYYYGGFDMANSSVSEVLGVPVNYDVVIDFSGFKDLIDVLGGIEVSVDKGFTDNLYPIAGKENDPCISCRYETVIFNSGLQIMNGETALKFVRSRHAEGDEGTDIAREARQQKTIDAIKTKVLSWDTILNPKRDMEILAVVQKSTQTNMNINVLAILGKTIFHARNSITNYLIPQNLLVNPPELNLYEKQYVFIPKAGNGNWQEIREWITTILPG